MFTKKKKKPQISTPTNFEHRVHTGFDKREGRYVGLPLQWASIVGNNQILKSTNRPLPLVDPSEITPTEILDLKNIVRGNHNHNQNHSQLPNQRLQPQMQMQPSLKPNGIILPKTSNVARSNSLRSSSPPRLRKDIKNNTNVPPSVPEEHIMQYPSMRGDKMTTMRENSPALSQNQEGHHNGNQNINQNAPGMHEHYYGGQNVNNKQVSPAGSMSSVPPIGLNHMGAHSHSSVGSHHSQLSQNSHQSQGQPVHHGHTGAYPQRPDQNQNVKNGNQHLGPGGVNPHIQGNHMNAQNNSTTNSNSAIVANSASAVAAAAAKQQHEQRLTHEQVSVLLKYTSKTCLNIFYYCSSEQLYKWWFPLEIHVKTSNNS